MQTLAVLEYQGRPKRTESGSSGGGGTFGCLIFLLIVGVVIYLVMRGRGDKQEQLGASHRPLPTDPVGAHTFACPYPKCPSCGAPGDKMKSNYDGMRKVAWSCGYCGAQAGVQELKDEELPASARQRLGLDAPAAVPGQPGYMPGPGGGGGMGGVGGLLTGMMIGNMMSGGGGHHHHDNGGGGGSDWGGGGSSSGSGSDWGGGSSSGSDWGDSGGGGSDWGDSGGSDSGGSDSGGGDW